MRAFRQLSVVLNEVFSLKTKEARAKAIAPLMADPVFAHLMRMAYDPEQKLTGLPPGMPDVLKLEVGIPDEMADTTVRSEYRRIKNFLPGTALQNLPATKREVLWIELLEGIHPKDAIIMTAIKDQELDVTYPGLNELLEEFGVPRINKEQTKVKKTPKSKSPKNDTEDSLQNSPDSSDAASATSESVDSAETSSDDLHDDLR
jgi:hypothetical protein